MRDKKTDALTDFPFCIGILYGILNDHEKKKILIDYGISGEYLNELEAIVRNVVPAFYKKEMH